MEVLDPGFDVLASGCSRPDPDVHFYARRLIEALGLQKYGGVVRISIAHYNTSDEIRRLLVALDEGIA